MRLEYDLTSDDYVAFNLYAAATTPALVALSRRTRLIGTVALPVGAVVALRMLGADLATMLVGAVVAVAVAWFSWPPIERASTAGRLRRLASAAGLGRTGETTLTWDEIELVETAAASQARVGWQRLERIGETKQHLFLFFGATEALVVPRRAGVAVDELARAAREVLVRR